jgi:hypothetical protein
VWFIVFIVPEALFLFMGQSEIGAGYSPGLAHLDPTILPAEANQPAIKTLP